MHGLLSEVLDALTPCQLFKSCPAKTKFIKSQVKVELVVYTGFTGMLYGQYGIPVWLSIMVYLVISGKHIRKC